MRIIIPLLLCLLCLVTSAQKSNSIKGIFIADTSTVQNDSTKVTIRNIFITGNRKTKEYIIRREIGFREGDAIEAYNIIPRIERARENIYNTQLFLEVIPQIRNWANGAVDVYFEVKERWYLFPLPYFKLVDRNLNQWIDEQKASLKRVNYGLKFSWNNVSGRNDKLRVYLVTGYTRQYSFTYDQPFADKKLKHGFTLGFSFNQNRQVNAYNDLNKQVFFPENNYGNNELGILKQQVRGEFGYSYRPDIYRRHYLRLNIINEKIADTIFKINPNYFGDGKSRVSFPELSYTYNYINLDSIAYPLRGISGSVSLMQRGLGFNKAVNMWQLDFNISKYITVARNHFSVQLYGKLKSPTNQPFYNLKALGYGDFYLRGLENYVVDGVASGLAKFTYRRKLLHILLPTLIKRNGFTYHIPVKIYAKAFGDVGYSYLQNPINTLLNNKMIYTGGFGIDIITFYDFQLKIEFSFNQLGQNGLFLHTQKEL